MGTTAQMMKTLPPPHWPLLPRLGGARLEERKGGSLYRESLEIGSSQMRRFVYSSNLRTSRCDMYTCRRRTTSQRHPTGCLTVLSWDAPHLRHARLASPPQILQDRLDDLVNPNTLPYASSHGNIRCGGCRRISPLLLGNNPSSRSMVLAGVKATARGVPKVC